MKNYLTIFFTLIFISCISQTKLNEQLNLMPWPKDIKENDSKFIIDSNLTISVNGSYEERVDKAVVSFLRRLADRSGVFFKEGFPFKNNKSAKICINFKSIADLTIEDDESYSLNVFNNSITIDANSDVGALRGIQTLLQLVSFDEKEYFFAGVEIIDSPRFVWRGLMIDAARHFQPVDVIKRNLDAMASVKMNVFHWHLCDDQGFRVESKVYPKLHEIGGDGLYYTQEQIKDVVAYASNLGIRVMPEFDVPGHATAILAAYPELGSIEGATYTVERNSGIFNPTLNPIIDETYEFLDNLFAEIAPLFTDEYFHIGGDENEGKHWDSNEKIQQFKKKNNLKDNHELQTYFNINLEKSLNKLGKKLMGWDEIMTPTMPTTAVIHSWRGENEGFGKGGTLIEAAKKGYNTVLSAGFSIDRMLSVEHHYSVELIGDTQLTNEERARILGGETTMWSELVTPLTIDSRIWPRSAAIAERLWSPKEVNDIDNMRQRLNEVSFRLEELGITHLTSRDVILRGMTNNQNIQPLIVLTKVCEPVKMYSRNKNGTEYKTFSPFYLFADACVADAEDAVSFNKEVSKFLRESNKESYKQILYYLNMWTENHEEILTISNNPKVKALKGLSKKLLDVSKLLASVLIGKKITKNQAEDITQYMNQLKEPIEDVELAVLNSLNDLISFSKANYLKD